MLQSSQKRAKQVIEELFKMYEPENQQKSMLNIWRLHIRPKYGISYRTLLRYKKELRSE